jgi:N-acetylglucosaminyldiphosphoundecaprenol N-acetyl-beta-D-mannosaminyltransferase
MKKITFLVLHLGYGGIENAIATLANLLSKDYDVEIISTYKLYSEPVFKINDKVKITYLMEQIKPNKKELDYYRKNKNYFMFIKECFKSIKVLYLRRKLMIDAIKKLDTDVIISTRILHNNWVSKYADKDCKKIAWEHNHHNNDQKYINNLVKSCKNMDYLVLVSKELQEFYQSYLGKKAIYIPNCLDSTPKKTSKLDMTNIISVGRLSKEKGFDDLLRLFKKLTIKYPEWHLNIIGDGMERNNLLDLAKELKLDDKVIFRGYQNKESINELLCDSSIYVMTSHTESFGLVLIEAMSAGVPCLAYTSAQGANEIISNGVDGYLIKDRNEDEMIEKISELINDSKLRNKLGLNAKEKAKEFSKEKIVKIWENILK